MSGVYLSIIVQVPQTLNSVGNTGRLAHCILSFLATVAGRKWRSSPPTHAPIPVVWNNVATSARGGGGDDGEWLRDTRDTSERDCRDTRDTCASTPSHVWQDHSILDVSEEEYEGRALKRYVSSEASEARWEHDLLVALNALRCLVARETRLRNNQQHQKHQQNEQKEEAEEEEAIPRCTLHVVRWLPLLWTLLSQETSRTPQEHLLQTTSRPLAHVAHQSDESPAPQPALDDAPQPPLALAVAEAALGLLQDVALHWPDVLGEALLSKELPSHNPEPPLHHTSAAEASGDKEVGERGVGEEGNKEASSLLSSCILMQPSSQCMQAMYLAHFVGRCCGALVGGAVELLRCLLQGKPELSQLLLHHSMLAHLLAVAMRCHPSCRSSEEEQEDEDEEGRKAGGREGGAERRHNTLAANSLNHLNHLNPHAHAHTRDSRQERKEEEEESWSKAAVGVMHVACKERMHGALVRKELGRWLPHGLVTAVAASSDTAHALLHSSLATPELIWNSKCAQELRAALRAHSHALLLHSHALLPHSPTPSPPTPAAPLRAHGETAVECVSYVEYTSLAGLHVVAHVYLDLLIKDARAPLKDPPALLDALVHHLLLHAAPAEGEDSEDTPLDNTTETGGREVVGRGETSKADSGCEGSKADMVYQALLLLVAGLLSLKPPVASALPTAILSATRCCS